jgi:hypothetical protein
MSKNLSYIVYIPKGSKFTLGVGLVKENFTFIHTYSIYFNTQYMNINHRGINFYLN